MTTKVNFDIKPVGTVNRTDNHVELKVGDEFKDGLLGLDQFSHICVLWWGTREYVAPNRTKMTLNPPYAPDKTMGLFATRAEFHPNPICLTTCPVSSVDVENGIVRIANIDADHGTPVIDIKGYYPVFDRAEQAKCPDWGFEMPDSVPDTGVEIWE